MGDLLEPLRPTGLEGSREQIRREPVAAGRDGHLHVARRASIQLRRPAGAGSRPSGEPPVLGVEQTGPHESLEVECRERPRDADGCRRVVTPHGLGLGSNPVVEASSCRFVEQGDRLEVGRTRVIHAPNSIDSRV